LAYGTSNRSYVKGCKIGKPTAKIFSNVGFLKNKKTHYQAFLIVGLAMIVKPVSSAYVPPLPTGRSL
jgi:hypothetical protein